ncbi:MAG: peptide ABC transporter substrate-binding protein, partial [Chloroflexota bacterium]|nr:peptide ABC transporter substrate-binding protein [Chloroflexota bacterium]
PGAAPSLQEGEIEEGAEIVVPFDAFGNAVTLDPHRSADYGGFWVMYPNVWAGLLRYDELGRVEPDLAESFDVSEDGLTYNFVLRPDLRFASGNPVVAEDFVRSWTRALDPANPSPMVAFMLPVSGVQEYLDEAEGAQLGFRAVDERTVEITLSEPYSFFPSYLASFVWSVVDFAVLEDPEIGEENFVVNGAGAGPWQFSAYELDTRFEMEPNPNYYGGASPSLARIVWPILTGPEAAADALERYRNDEAVSADVPLSLMTAVEEDETLSQELRRIEPAATTRALAMDFNQAPFDDVRVRRAFALALDRDRYAEIYEGTWTPTSVFSPPVLTELANYEPPEGIEYDPDAARALLEEAGYPNGEGLPEIVYYHPAGESEEELERIRAVLQIFADELGVAVALDDTLTPEQIADLQADTGGRQFDLIWWQNVTETPHLLSEVFRPDSPYMEGVFNWRPDLEPSGEFDPGADAEAFADLVAQADLEQDEAARNDLYRQGEELVLRNAVYVPIANWVPMFVQKPWLQGTRQGPWTGRLPALFDQDVVVLQR